MGAARIGAVRAWRISYGDAGTSLAGAWAGLSARSDGEGSIRRTDRAEATGRLSRTEPALGGSDPGGRDGVLWPRPAQPRRAALRAARPARRNGRVSGHRRWKGRSPVVDRPV